MDPMKHEPTRQSASANNVYADPQPDTSSRPSRPGGLTAVCVIAGVLGLLGFCGVLVGGANLVFGQKMQQAFAFNQPPKLQEAQTKMNASINAVTQRYFAVSLSLLVFQAILCGLLAYGGFRCLSLNPGARNLLLIGCGVGPIFLIARFISFVIMQLEIMPIMQTYFETTITASAGPGNSPQQMGAEFGASMAKASIIAGMVFNAGWSLTQLIFFGFAFRYLKKPAVAALFEKR